MTSAVAVFLGPTLPVEAARALLDAEYLPPAGFGDVYRLIGGAIRTLVIVDGVFHGRAAVWQREICAAIEGGVRVFGAGSMGALRAAELSSHGMIGMGRVFEAYRDGAIDGDDEVALHHAGPEHGYRALSSPLVNLRFSLEDAAAAGFLDREEAAMLVGAAKAIPYWERSLPALRATAAWGSIPALRRARLAERFARGAVDHKARDATSLLSHVARLGPEGAPATPASPANVVPYHDRFRLLEREFARGGTPVITGRKLAAFVLSDPARRRVITRWLAASFFVRRWAHERGVVAPDGDDSPARSDHGLTDGEHHELSARRALTRWLLSTPPDRFGLSAALQDEALVPAPADLGPFEPLCPPGAVARSLPYVAAWCDSVGAAPSPEVRARLYDRFSASVSSLERDNHAALIEPFLCAVWAIEEGPLHFGFASWSLEAETLGEIAMTGTTGQLASSLRGQLA